MLLARSESRSVVPGMPTPRKRSAGDTGSCPSGVRVTGLMCFSPQADFAAGAVVTAMGAETLRRVRVRRELIVGALPLLFGLHLLVEGFVWLGLRGEITAGLGNAAKETYIVFAHAVLPALVPLGFTFLEPDRRRARWMWPLVGLGLLLGAYLLWQITAYPVRAQEQARCIDYVTHTPNDLLIGVLYVAVTCGPALMSSLRRLRWFGVVSLVGVITAALVRFDELTSVWCVYVALVSVLILEHFRRQRASDAATEPSPPSTTVTAGPGPWAGVLLRSRRSPKRRRRRRPPHRRPSKREE